MGRGKVKLQRIADKGRRTVCFSQRKSSLLKKARELAVLCDVEVAVVVFSDGGGLDSFSSQSSPKETFERYKKFLDAESTARNNCLAQNVRPKDLFGGGTTTGLREENRFIEQSMTELKVLEVELIRELLKIKSMKNELLKDASHDLD